MADLREKAVQCRTAPTRRKPCSSFRPAEALPTQIAPVKWASSPRHRRFRRSFSAAPLSSYSIPLACTYRRLCVHPLVSRSALTTLRHFPTYKHGRSWSCPLGNCPELYSTQPRPFCSLTPRDNSRHVINRLDLCCIFCGTHHRELPSNFSNHCAVIAQFVILRKSSPFA